MSTGKKTCRKKHKSRYRTNKRLTSTYGTKHLDQIKDEIEKGNKQSSIQVEVENTTTYCTECDRHFLAEDILAAHKKTKVHKKRVKLLREEQHNTKDSERAAGLISQ